MLIYFARSSFELNYFIGPLEALMFSAAVINLIMNSILIIIFVLEQKRIERNVKKGIHWKPAGVSGYTQLALLGMYTLGKNGNEGNYIYIYIIYL